MFCFASKAVLLTGPVSSHWHVKLQSLQPVVCNLSKSRRRAAAERVPAVPVQLAGDPVPEAVPWPQAGEQFPRILLCALQHSVDIAVTHSARRILTELRSSALNADAPQAPYDVARTEARTFNSGGPGDAGRGVSALQC